MQVVILCGGKGIRLWPTTEKIPKPLIPVGDKPILWHIIKKYSRHGHKDFILCLGYLGNQIKEFFQNPKNVENDWNITFVDTGLNSSKAERLRRIQKFIKGSNFFVAYGDDLSDVDVNEVLKFHQKNNKIVTLTAVNPISNFGILEINGNTEIVKFKEKPKLNHWINGGYFVFNKRIFDFLKEGWDLETDVFDCLTKKREIVAFKHDGFWRYMNTLKDVNELNEMWKSGELQKIIYN